MAPKSSKKKNEAESYGVLDFPDKPVPLVELRGQDSNSFVINEEAIEILRHFEHELAVVCIAGMYRTGKSSLLNWLQDRQAGFRVGSTVEACTRGIWLWGRPKEVTKPNGEKMWVVFLDTEGLGGLEASQQYDARIFSLALLLCSTLIYNSVGSIDESAINNLSFTGNLSKHIKVKASESGSLDEELASPNVQSLFPSFLWVLRDFSLELVDEDGNAISSSEYLESALRPQFGTNRTVMERNRVRQALTSFFPIRDCVTLVRPVSDEAALQQVDALPLKSLRSEFSEQLESLKAKLYGDSSASSPSALRPKVYNEKAINGPMFVGLLEAYVQAINTGGVPTISSAWDSVALSECKTAVSAGLSTFKRHLSAHTSAKQMPLESESLDAHFETATEEALIAFQKRAIGESASKYREELKQKLEEEKTAIRKENIKYSTAACTKTGQSLYSEIFKVNPSLENDEETKESSSTSTIEKFAEHWKEFVKRYLQLQDLRDELNSIREQQQLFEGREQVYKKQLERIQTEEADLMTDKAKLEAETKSHTDLITSLKASVAKLEAELKLAETERLAKVQQIQADLESVKSRLQEEQQEHETTKRHMKELSARHGPTGCQCIIQ